MKKGILFIMAIALIGLTVGSCGLGKTAKSAEPTADKFYEHLKDLNYDEIGKMIALAETGSTLEEWMEVLKRKEVLGGLKDVKKKMGFNTKYNNGVTTVELDYTCTYELGTTTEKITLIEVGEDFKIYAYEFDQDQ